MKLPVKLFFVCITGGRWHGELELNIKSMYEHVDYLIVIDGNFKEDQTTHDELIKIDKDNKITNNLRYALL